MYKYLLLCLLLVRFCNAQANGILVDKPKVYDDYYLQSQLDSLKARLASLNALDQATLLGKIGGIQGSTLQQSSFSIQGMGPATPSVATSLPPAGVTPSGSNGTTTTTSALTPSGATPPPPTLSMPSTFAPSSLDALSEEMQLTSQIINLQLLLDGALNDRFIPGSQQPKRHITLGFSITVDPHLRNKRRLENRLAEVEITITNTPDLADATETPSVMTLLPREKTYNVASLVDNSFSLGGGGVIAGVFSVGAGWLWGKKTYYLVQQQDTLAIQRNTSTFAWQFRPVLNRKFVVSGTRQTFVQFSIPVGSPMKCSGQISIRTGWRKLDPKTGLASDLTDESPATLIEIPFFDLTPTAQAVDVTDIGGGMVSVRILGSYNQGLHFRIGSAILDQSTPGFSYSGDRINFIAAAKDIAAFGVIMIGRDGKENPISTAQQPPVLPPCAVPAAASSITRSYPPRSITPEAPAPSTHTLSSDEVGFNIAPTARVLQTAYPVLAASGPDPVSAEFTAKATAKPFSDSQSEVTITLENPPADFSKPGASLNPVVVLVGDQVFGLRNAPFRSRSETSITFLAPTDLLKSNRKLKVGQLLWGDGYVATAELALGTFPSNDFSVSGASIILTGDPEKVAITGSGLTGATLSKSEFESDACATLAVPQSTLAILMIKKSCVDQVKQVILSNGSNLPLIVTVPAVKPDTQSSKPVLKPQGSVALNATQITITGSGLDQVSAIRFGKIRLSSTLSLKKDSITVRLTPEITATEGVRFLDLTFADGTKSRHELTVKKPN